MNNTNQNSTAKPEKFEQFKEELATLVALNDIFFADSDSERLQPYIEESRGRKVGCAYAVVFPRSVEMLAHIVKLCNTYYIPIVPQGGNTGRCFGAQSYNPYALIINLKHLNKVRGLDTDNMTITVEAGCILEDIQKYIAKSGYFFPLSFGAEGSCQLGGNLATNAGGVNVLRYGNTRDLVLGIEVVTADGKIMNTLYGLRKNNSGYDLRNLFIGSEGTLGIITAMTLKIFPPESNTSHAFIAVNTVKDAVTCLRKLQAHFGNKVSTFEIMPNKAMELLEKDTDTRCPIGNTHPWYIWYKIADSNTEQPLFDDNSEFLYQLMEEELVIDATIASNETMKKHFAEIRELIVTVQKNVSSGVAVKNDVSVPVSLISTLIEKGNAAAKEICPEAIPYPFGHIGDGNIHYNIMCPETIPEKVFKEKYYEKIEKAILEVTAELQGSFSAEHGVGGMKTELMATYLDPVALEVMKKIKKALDPHNIMNPGKVLP